MSPLPESAPTLNWKDPEVNLATPAGVAEAKQKLRKLNSDGGTVRVEYSGDGRFPITGTAGAGEEKFAKADPEWFRDDRCHLEVDPVTANLPPRVPSA